MNSLIAKLTIPEHLKPQRYVLIFIVWKLPPPREFDLDRATESMSVESTHADPKAAKAHAARNTIKFYPGCAVLIDTLNATCERADNFNAACFPLKWEATEDDHA